MKRNRQLLLMCFFGILITSCDLYGQEPMNSDGNKVVPYYLNFNTAQKSNVFEVRGEFLHLQYSDAYGKAPKLVLIIRDWNNQHSVSLNLNKEFGSNYFDINFKEHGITPVVDQSYTCILTDEMGKKYELYFKYLAPVKKVISADIIVNPKYLECNADNGANLIEFYSSVSGGKAPYTLNWYVLNKNRTQFLYQPSQVNLKVPGYTATIQVDKSPEYYVLLYVKDACGNERTSTVQVTCQENKKKINTLFFESLDKALLKTSPVIN